MESREERIARYWFWLQKAFPPHDVGLHVSPESWGEGLRWCLEEIQRQDEELRSLQQYSRSLEEELMVNQVVQSHRRAV